jgi:hypothetical protein
VTPVRILSMRPIESAASRAVKSGEAGI